MSKIENKDVDEFEGGEPLMGKVKVDEDADKCCFCIPIDIGVVIIGILFILSGVS